MWTLQALIAFFFYIHFLTSLLNLTSHSIKVLRLCQLISGRIIAVIDTMSTCQLIKATPVKSSNGALLPLQLITWPLRNYLP